MTVLQRIINNVNNSVIAREELVVNSIYGLLTGLNVLSYGPPGTAKSLTSRAISASIGGEVFVIQLDPNLTKEDVFGGLNLAALDEGRMERNVQGYAPTAHIIHFDEVDRGGKAIEAALLSLLNEGVYKNGDKEYPIAARLKVGTTNGRIQDPASWDRWAIKVYTPYIGSDQERLSELMAFDPKPVEQVATIDEIDIERAKLPDVSLHSDVAEQAHIIGSQINSKLDYSISDRKWVQITKVLRAAALIDGRETTSRNDWWAARNLLWDDIESIKTVDSILIPIAGTKQSSLVDLVKRFDALEQQFAALKQDNDMTFVSKASTVAALMVRLNEFNASINAGNTGDLADRISTLRAELTSFAMGG